MPIICPFQVELPPPKPLHELMLDHFHEFKNDVALEEDGLDQPVKMTYPDVRRLSIILANNLYKLGFRKSDVIAVYLENRIHFATLLLAVSSLGGTISGVNPTYTIEELRRQLQDSRSKFIFTKKSLLNKVTKACESLPKQVQRIILVDGTEDTNSQGLVALNDLYQGNFQQFPKVPIDCKEDVLLLPYSSGTTGLPKGVMLTHANLSVMFYAQHSNGAFRARRRNLVTVMFLPFFHMTGIIALIFSIHNGNRAVLMTRYDAIRYVELVAKHKAALISCVPSTLVYLTKDKRAEKYDFSSVMAVAFGAAPAGKELIESVMKRFPNVSMIRQVLSIVQLINLRRA